MFEEYRNAKGTALCRMVPYENELYGVKKYDILELPMYNEFFTINFDDLPPSTRGSAISDRPRANIRSTDRVPRGAAARRGATVSRRNRQARIGTAFNFINSIKSNSPPNIRSEQLNRSAARNVPPQTSTRSSTGRSDRSQGETRATARPRSTMGTSTSGRY